MFETILLVLTLFYGIQIAVFCLAAFAARYRSRSEYFPTVDIIIAARNEEERIGPCLESIGRLSYPKDRLKVTVVDDRSSDRTAAIVRGFASTRPWIDLLTAAPPSGHLRGKTNAVTQAIEATSGEIILFTDADCEVPEHWVEETVRYYTTDRVGVVAGFTSLQGRSLFQRMQALDWLVLFAVASGVTRLGFPVTAVGTNLSVRRRAYDMTGGYRKIPFSVTEDYALFHAVTRVAGYKARFPRNPGTLVSSHPCPTWLSLHQQKKRWFCGGKGMDVKSLSIFVLNYAFSASILLGAFLAPASLGIPLAVKILADLLMTLPPLSTFRRWDTLAAFPLYELYYFIYVLFYPPLVLVTDAIVWKEQDFGRAARRVQKTPV